MADKTNERIAKYRKSLGLTQADVTKLIGLKTTTYSQKEKYGIIDCETLKRIAKAFNVSCEVLLYDTPPRETTADGFTLTYSEKNLILALRGILEEKYGKSPKNS